jgi:small subunit ribosomal protein S18
MWTTRTSNCFQIVNPDGKIAPRSQTGTCAKYQRELAKAVKNARYMGLLPEPGQK